MKNRSVLITVFLFFCSFLQAQQNQPVKFVTGDFNTSQNISNNKFDIKQLSGSLFNKHYYVLLQFSVLPGEKVKSELKKAGIELYGYLPKNAFWAKVNENYDFNLSKKFLISSIDIVPALYKSDVSSEDAMQSNAKDEQAVIAVSYFSFEDKEFVEKSLIEKGASLPTNKLSAGATLYCKFNYALLKAIAKLPFVTSVSKEIITDRALNYKSIGAHAVSGLQALNGKNLQGLGVTVGIGDNADITTHIDFSNRVINRSPWVPADHGTHTSGTTAGAGIINVKNHGMAPKATIINNFFSDIITNTPTYVMDNKMIATNNSYYSSANGCPGEGKYSSLSNFIDEQMNSYTKVLHVIAAGNDGSYTCSPYPASYATVKSGWQCAKNVLTVGAINTDDYGIAYFSSRGPVKDGRLKPEIVSGGWAVNSTNANNRYGLNFGTSMAAPGVTGAVVLMTENYRRVHAGADPESALMKALLCNTAEDLGNPGPDFIYGFGLINARRAVAAIDSNRYFVNSVNQSDEIIHTVSLPKNARRLKIMLYWADKEALSNAAVSLVNDLDVTVTDPGAVVHMPMILNPDPASVNVFATEGQDHTNNIEQVVIENPVAGDYTVNVKGFSVPVGPQQYYVTYEILDSAVTVEYPFGGETWVPGEPEIIRWSAYGSEANLFKIEYSTNNGTSWNTIKDSVAATSRSYVWNVDTAVTNQALIKVSRIGTSLTGQSNYNFTVLGQPDITVSKICEGAVQVLWKPVAGSTSYDILQLTADSMRVIGSTTDTAYIIMGLDRYKTYWLGVAAKNGSFSGRRSVSKDIIPNGGACTLNDFVNDLIIDSILEPSTARCEFSNIGDAYKKVKVMIRNLSAATLNGPFDVTFEKTGGCTFTETINTSIAANDTLIYTFTNSCTTPVNCGTGANLYRAWVTKAGDANHLNDTAVKIVKDIPHPLITALPVTEDFETMTNDEFIRPEMAIGNNNRLDFFPGTERGRARAFVNSGFAFNGSKALTLDQRPYSDVTNTDTVIFNYNLPLYSSKQLRYDFYYRNQGAVNEPGNRVWIRGSENDPWLVAYNLYDNQADLGLWKQGVININEVLSAANPPQTVSATFQVKIAQEGNTSANSPAPEVDNDDGYTFDDIRLSEAINDVAVTKITSPDKGGCALTENTPVSIKVKNYSNASLSGIAVSYQVDSGVVITDTIQSIAPNQTIDFVFSQTADLSIFKDYSVRVWIKYSGDNYSPNDSILDFVVHNSPVISSFPYLESFENDDGYFFVTGKNTSWQWGTPAKPIINKAPNGNKCWVTSISDTYNDNETSYLVSPCFNLSGLTQPVLSFSHIFDIELDYDYAWVEYSVDGENWLKLGTVGNGTNWYDNSSLINWRVSNKKWHVASYNLPVTAANMRFRFVMSSDAGLTMEGLGIDDVHVFDKSLIYTGPAITAITQPVNGNGWVEFFAGGKKTVSINPNGMQLGNTTVQVYPFTGAVRNSNNQYYLNRNIVIQTANPPTGLVGVRFYFTAAEADSAVKANNCTSCSTIYDPYELGVSKYSGSVTDENNSLADDINGFFQFILPDNTKIIPYDNGYYAEFSVNNFSEYWLSKSLVKNFAASNCKGDTITMKAATTGTVYQWQVDNGSGYSNLVNGVNYVGATTNSLQLVAIPGNFTGYKYRCVVNSVNGPETILRFTNVWNGSTNTDWFTASNWSCGVVPDEFTDVIIPAGLPNYPVLLNPASVRSIKLKPGGPLTINGGNFNIKGK